MSTHLPLPSPIELEHSQKLQVKIRQAIARAENQCLDFASFMQMALYEPGLGYYVAGLRKFGEQGDFITAPEISPLFSRCIANQCQQVLTQLDLASNQLNAEKNILEFGAGSGIMAVDILLELNKQNSLPDNYFILEISPDLISRQQELIQEKAPELFHKVTWLSQYPENFAGVVLANEVLDAMPVHLFKIKNHRVIELGVKFENHQFVLVEFENKINPNFFDKIPDFVYSENNYYSEICLATRPWLKDLYNSIDRGVVLLVDYGFPEKEYYHPQRNRGTLMCHYKHYAHGDFLSHIGLQDITAHVDFTAVAVAADDIGFNVAGFTTQADFLMATGLLNLSENTNNQEQFQQAQEIKKLLLPSEMGELFKVLGLTKNFDRDLLGFEYSDHRHRL